MARPPRRRHQFVVDEALSRQGLGVEVNEDAACLAAIHLPPVQLTYAFTAGTAHRSLPVCEYPQYATYSGTGDVNAAASFAAMIGARSTA